MDRDRVIRNFYVLPCCVLLLNLVIGVFSYKLQVIRDPLLRTAAIIGMVLFGGSAVGVVMTPLIRWLVPGLHRRSRRQYGRLGEVLFLVFLGLLVFWLYYRMYILGAQSILPREWRNGR